MLRNYLFILLIVLIATVRSELASLQGVATQQEVHDQIVVDADISGDTIRVLTYGDFLGSFYISGASVETSGDSATISTSAFYFSSGSSSLVGLPLSYYYTYAKGQVSPGNVSATGTVAAFIPSVLIEYQETNGEDGYQLDEDTVLGWIRLDQYTSFDIENSESNIVAKQDGKDVSTKVYVVDATSPDGVFGLRFTVAGAPVTIGSDISITSEQSKVDILINNYYDSNINDNSIGCSTSSARFSCKSTGPSSNAQSRLALASFFLSTSFDVNANLNSNSLSVTGGDVEIGLTWVKTVTINNSSTSASVSSSTTASANGKAFMNSKVSASYQGNLVINSFDSVRPSSIYFDPIIGAGAADTSSSSIISISFGAIILSAIFALLF